MNYLLLFTGTRVDQRSVPRGDRTSEERDSEPHELVPAKAEREHREATACVNVEVLGSNGIRDGWHLFVRVLCRISLWGS
jgi:hypothetical protein